MLHSQALSERRPEALREDDHPDCQTPLLFLYNGFWDDVKWGVFFCPQCDQIICCVDGGVHWWNYTSANPLPGNLEMGRRLAAELKAEQEAPDAPK